MNHKFHIAMLTAVALMASSVAVAQSAVGLDRSLARVEQSRDGRPLWAASAADPLSAITGYLGNRGLSDAALASLAVTGTHVGDGDVTQVRMEQRVDGVAIYGAYVKAALNAQGELIHLIDHTYDVTFASSSRIDELQALKAAMTHLHPSEKALFTVADVRGNSMLFDGGAFFQGKPSVTAVLLPMEGGSLAGGWLVQTWTRKSNDLHHTVVDGEGRVLEVESRTANDSYNVFVEDPGKGAQAVVSGPGAGNAQSPVGWLGTGTQTTINLTGNNTHTYLDAVSNNAPDSGGSAVADGNFLTAANLSAQPSTSGNMAVAAQNLFYLNNIVHDTLYRHGFTETAGNFQTNNFGNGGAGNDAVNAEAQDGGGTDNANFATPTDGSAPRMQMYLWSGSTPSGLVSVSGLDYGAYGSSFGAALTLAGVTGALAVYNDATAPASDGCEAVSAGSLTGKVVIVDRGLCNFTVKVKNAQNAGALAVLIANNDAGSAFAPGGTDRKVKIPSAMVSLADGVTLKGLAGSPGTLRKNPEPPLKIDGDLDSDIVFHEYGHGLTWRMIGSMSGPLAGAIGEGASDVLAFLINSDDRIGEYAYANPLGIRRQPYASHRLTYKDVTGAGVHDDGEIYARAMWRVLVNYQAQGLMADDLLGDFVKGMSYTPAQPAFEDMREGMLQAANAGRHCAIWRGFADTGIGVGAKGSVSRRGTVSITESFTIPSSCP